jgi:6-pyruvoyltetrahydropterin/6-carboxytetrahydropterin synthase
MISVSSSSNFSAAHFYSNSQWSDQKNREIFGKCFTQFGHGHDYRIEVEVPVDQGQKLSEELIVLVDRLDHQHLNFEIEEFKTKIPTTENIALFCKENLSKAGLKVLSLKLFETPYLWVELKNQRRF